jgi:acyl-CoA thioester hydrolase
MIRNDLQIRVRYAETDQMSYVYYGHYAQYFEVARVEMLRSLGFTYKKLEEEGVMLPVLEYSIKYYRPAYYDDLLTIKTEIRELPAARIRFFYETFNEKNELLNRAETTLVFVNRKNGKPTSLPDDLREVMEKFFESAAEK